MSLRRLLVPVLALSLGACASLSEKECRTADWERIGYHDGGAGADRTRVEDHGEACGKIGVAVDRKRYFQGYEAGLLRYCTPENAVTVGLSGAGYGGVCPPALDARFAENYRAARYVYEQRQRVSELDGRRRSLETKLDKAASDDEKKNLRAELSRLDHELREERDRLYDEEGRLRRFTGAY